MAPRHFVAFIGTWFWGVKPGVAEYHPGAAHQTYRMLDDFIQDAFNKKL